MNKPLLSVIMPTYNGGAYIRFALDSIRAQEKDLVSRLEILVVDDGSTDNTLDIISEYTVQLPIRIIRASRIGNWVKGLNEGLMAAKGEFSCTLHQDDAWAPNRIKTLFQHMERNTEIHVFVHNAHFIDNQGKRIGPWSCPFKGKSRRIEPNVFFRHLFVQDFLCINTPVFRTKVINEIGLFDDQFWYTTDWDYWLRLFGTYPSFFINKSLSFFRIHADAQTVVGSQNEDVFKEQLELIYERHAGKLNTELSEDSKIIKASKFSNTVNVSLAQALHQHSAKPLLNIVKQGLRLSPPTFLIYIRDSRILERLGARLCVRKSLH